MKLVHLHIVGGIVAWQLYHIACVAIQHMSTWATKVAILFDATISFLVASSQPWLDDKSKPLLCLTLAYYAKQFSKWVYQFTLHQSLMIVPSAKCFSFSTTLGIVSLLTFSYSGGGILASFCGFNLPFHDDC